MLLTKNEKIKGKLKMDKKIDISVDASMFSVNLTGCAESDYKRYIKNLRTMEEFLKLKNVTVCRNYSVVDSLMSNSRNVSRLCNEPELSHVDCQDILSHAQRLVDHMNEFEGHHKIKNVDMSEVNVTPRKICIQCLAATAILRSHCEEGNHDHYIMVSRDLRSRRSKAKIEAYVTNVVSSRLDIAKLPTGQDSLKESVPIFSDFKEFLRCLNPEDILSRSESGSKIRLAIHIELLSRLKHLNHVQAVDWNNIRSPYVGVDFFRYWSRANKSRNYSKPFLNAIADIYYKEDSTCEVLDTECGKEVPLVSMGRVVPMRFSYDNLIYIHFWLSYEGSIELASIHTREVSVIPDPSRLILRGR